MCITFKTLSVLQNYCYVTCWLHGPFNERRLFDAIFLETRPAEIYKQRKKLPWLENRWQFLVKSLSYTFPIRVNENQTPFTTNLFTLSSSSLNAKVALKVLPKNIRAQILSTFQTGSIRKKSLQDEGSGDGYDFYFGKSEKEAACIFVREYMI